MAKDRTNVLERTSITLGLTKEVKLVISNHQRTAGRPLSVQDAIRELILIGGGVPCDHAMLAIYHRQLRTRAEQLIYMRTREFARALEVELATVFSSTDMNGEQG